MNNILKNTIIFVVGAVTGGFVVKKALEKKYQDMIEEEICSIREVNERRRKRTEESTNIINDSDEIHEYLNKIIKNYGGDSIIKSGVESEPIRGSNPYVITVQEFEEGMPGYDQITITYYTDDDTLADENEQIIDDVRMLVGHGLEHFGEGSDDPDMVYIRNESLSIDYEVICSHSSYVETVLGKTKET